MLSRAQSCLILGDIGPSQDGFDASITSHKGSSVSRRVSRSYPRSRSNITGMRAIYGAALAPIDGISIRVRDQAPFQGNLRPNIPVLNQIPIIPRNALKICDLEAALR
jgi:hypothetical protein